MKKILPILFLIIIFYGIYNSIKPCSSEPEKKIQTNTQASSSAQSHKITTQNIEEATYNYILDVINHGSSKLHFKKNEVMEGGYISPEDAPKVACYVLELSGKKCPHPYNKDAQLFFSSVCAGCHGNDGKGINGAYPDLTRPVLLGLEQ